jgi:hypothetical protein
MVVVTRDEGEAEKLAAGAPNLTRTHGMPIDPAPYPRPSSSEPACRAFVAARLHAPTRADALLRAIRVRRMAGGLLDEPAFLAAAAYDAGLDPDQLTHWSEGDDVEAALQEDVALACRPAPAAGVLAHKLGGPPEQRRYSTPTYELRSDGALAVVPGFNPVEAYECAIANLAPELPRRRVPESVSEVLEWASEPLATAEVAAVMQLDAFEARAALSSAARPQPAGADFYWTL